MLDRLENQIDKERRDMKVLRVILRRGPIGIVKLSNATDLPQHKVRYSLRMLENDGLIDPTPQGAVPADDISERLEQINAGLGGLVSRVSELPFLDAE